MNAADDIYEQALPPAEFEARRLRDLALLDGPDGEEIRDFIGWFLRRYPTPLARLAYCRRKYQESMATRGRALPTGP